MCSNVEGSAWAAESQSGRQEKSVPATYVNPNSRSATSPDCDGNPVPDGGQGLRKRPGRTYGFHGGITRKDGEFKIQAGRRLLTTFPIQGLANEILDLDLTPDPLKSPTCSFFVLAPPP